jgi:hypothetical protein
MSRCGGKEPRDADATARCLTDQKGIQDRERKVTGTQVYDASRAQETLVGNFTNQSATTIAAAFSTLTWSDVPPAPPRIKSIRQSQKSAEQRRAESLRDHHVYLNRMRPSYRRLTVNLKKLRRQARRAMAE